MNLARLISTVHNQKNSYMNGYLKALGLSHGQAITLKIIHEENCIKQDDLNKRLQIDKSAVTRILKTLEEKGLIVKTRCEDDKRNQHIVLTDEGKKLYPSIKQIVLQTANEMLEGIDENKQKQLEKLLLKMKKNLKQCAEN